MENDKQNNKVVLSCRAIIVRGFFALNALVKKYSSVPSDSKTVLIIFEGKGRPSFGDIFFGFPSPEMLNAAEKASNDLKKYRDNTIGHLIAYGKLPLPKGLDGVFWHIDTGPIPYDLHTVHEDPDSHDNYLSNYRLEKGALVEDADDYVAFAIENLVETRIVKAFDDKSFVVATHRPDDNNFKILKVAPNGTNNHFFDNIKDELGKEVSVIEKAILESGIATKSNIR